MYKLRGHHLLCLLGFRGMGYSEEYIKNMKVLHNTLRTNSKQLIQLVNGPDQLCEKFPEDGDYHCEDTNIYNQDATILDLLGFQVGQVITWGEIETNIQKRILPTDINIVCQSCSWRSYGVCEEGVQLIHEGKGLTTI